MPQLEYIEAIEKRLWKAVDTLRSNSSYASNEYFFPGIVTGRSGSLGTVLFVPGSFWPLNTTLWVKEFEKVSRVFAQHLLFLMKLDRYNGGAAVPALNRNDVHRVKVLSPPQSLTTLFDEYSFRRQVEALNKASGQLANARELLLHRLMHGEIAV